MLAAAAALLISNSPLASLYDHMLGTPADVHIGPLALRTLLRINGGLTAIFFFLVGLEIERELLWASSPRWRRRFCRSSPRCWP